jgi:hypothetical protein
MRAEPAIADTEKDFKIVWWPNTDCASRLLDWFARQVALAVAENCVDYELVAITNHAHRLFLQTDSSGSLFVHSVRLCPRYVSSPYPNAGKTMPFTLFGADHVVVKGESA